ncbi:DUF2271 domain-containing protein [Neptuniibacter halophilus]|uniref:DUF2271 domain-containing protein n=1 Tax=Neptuniibacter halophilus TaxID=651666 RepID=UPI002574490A|nr:DUF2271 domain-containing protein [Neptuniibacter halophilus]
MKRILNPALLVCCLLGAVPAVAQQVQIDFTLPQLQVAKYQRPFLAVWVERKGERRAVGTVSVWYDDKKWLKDIRRWWRKDGRYQSELDGVSGATRPPGDYQLIWHGEDQQGQALPDGEYTLYLEAVREHGDHTLLKQKFTLGQSAQTYRLDAGEELGPVVISVGEK